MDRLKEENIDLNNWSMEAFVLSKIIQIFGKIFKYQIVWFYLNTLSKYYLKLYLYKIKS